VDALPDPIQRVEPKYPNEARSQHIEGFVLVQALVGKDGSVQGTRIMKSIPALDSAAVIAVRQWRFKPAKSMGKPVAVWVVVPLKFSLH
jgi:protein TonB